MSDKPDTTDLKSKTVEELREMNGPVELVPEIVDELARRLETVTQELQEAQELQFRCSEAHTRTMAKLLEAQKQNAAHDAEVAAKALENFRFNCKGARYQTYIDEAVRVEIAEYRAKGRKG